MAQTQATTGTLNRLSSDTFMGNAYPSLSATARSVILANSTDYKVSDPIEVGADLSLEIPTTSSVESIGYANSSDLSSLVGIYDFVESGCVWTGDSLASTLNATMSDGYLWIGGQRLRANCVRSRAFTASRDTYVYATNNGNGTAAISYVENTNNLSTGAPTPPLNAILLAIIISGASSIAAATSINQGQETMVLPIVSSVPYAVTDNLGNLICPRDPNRKIIGYRQIVANFDAGTNALTDVTAFSMPVNILNQYANRKIKLTGMGLVFESGTARTVSLYLRESSTTLQQGDVYSSAINTPTLSNPIYITSPSSGLHTYKGSIICASGANVSIQGSSTQPSFIMAELV